MSLVTLLVGFLDTGQLSKLLDGIRSTGTGAFIVYGNAIALIGSGGNKCIAARALGSGGIVLGRAQGINTNGFGALNCTVAECTSFNQDLIVTSKFIHDSNNNLQGLVNCRAQNGAPVQIEIYDENGQAVLCNPIASQGQASQC
jgi:hypothetical protein